MDITNFALFLLMFLLVELAAGTSESPDFNVDPTPNETTNISNAFPGIHVDPLPGSESNGTIHIGISIPGETNSVTETCREIFFGEFGEFSSPNYPDLYPMNLQCEWKIIAPEGHTIKITFDSFQVESSMNCIYDRVSIFDGTDLAQVLCGNTLPSPVQSNINTVTVSFYSDGVVAFSGFSARFMVMPLDTTTQNTTDRVDIANDGMMTIMLVSIGVMILLGGIGLVAGIFFCKMTKDRVQSLQKRRKRIRAKRNVVNQHLAPPPPLPAAYCVNHPPLSSLVNTLNYETRPEMTKADMT